MSRRRHTSRSDARGPSQRQLRAGELVRRALADILAREDIRDPALQGVSVTVSEVRASPDLKAATVFAAPLGGDNAGEVIEGLNRSARFLRGRLGKEMEMKSTPRLRFVLDETFDTAAKMDAVFARPDVRRDLD